MSRDPRQGFDVWYVLAAPFETAIALAAVISSVIGLADPSLLALEAIGRSVGDLVYAWTVMYLIGGVLILSGLFRRSLRAEAAGLCLFVAAILTNGIAIIDVSGLRGVVSAATFLCLALASFGRLAAITRAWRRER